MRQFIGTAQGHDVTPMVRDLLLSVSPPRVQGAGRDDQAAQVRGAGAAAGSPAGAERPDAAARRPDRQTRRGSFERFLIFTPDGNVREAAEPASAAGEPASVLPLTAPS